MYNIYIYNYIYNVYIMYIIYIHIYIYNVDKLIQVKPR